MNSILFRILSIICLALFIYKTHGIELSAYNNGDIIVIILGCVCWIVAQLEDIKNKIYNKGE